MQLCAWIPCEWLTGSVHNSFSVAYWESLASFIVDECVSELRTCHPGYFQCGSGHCISERFKCDGNADCLDFTDESSCREFAAMFIFIFIYLNSEM